MPDKKLTIERSMADFKKAYRAKRKLIEREMEDHKFALGEQWSAEDVQKLKDAGMKPITDNRIQPLIFLVTGLQRQNRTEFKAFPEGQEDGVTAEITTALFKNAIKTSKFGYKFSHQFKNGITCGESNIELYLDHTENLLNGKPCWKESHGNMVFPDPAATEYDFWDGRYVYKLTKGISKDDLISLYPEKESKINKIEKGRLDFSEMESAGEAHHQLKDYPKETKGGQPESEEDDCIDLIERQYKKWVERCLIVDQKTGEITESESLETAKAFIADYQGQIEADQQAYAQAQQQALDAHMAQMQAVDPMAAALPVEQHMAMIQQAGQMPPPPPERDPNRFKLIERKVPEVWIFAHVPGMKEPLADERAWFYPLWKRFGIVPYNARFSTAPLEGDDRHLCFQGLVHGLKGSQEKHNKAEMLMLRHLNSSANSGWEVEEGQLVDPDALKNFGSAPGTVVMRTKGSPPLTRLFPLPLSQGHAQISVDSAESIKSQSGVNADMLAAQEGGTDSGRAIALRQRQGLVMIQEFFDNASQTMTICGEFLLSQLGKIFDTESAMKVLGDAFLIKNFPPPMVLVEGPMGQPAIGPDGQPAQEPMKDASGQPMKFDKEKAEIAIAEVLSGKAGEFNVAVGETVASETMRMAITSDLKEISEAYPGLIPPDIMIEESQLPQSTKNRILSIFKNAQALAAQGGGQPPKPPAKANAAKENQ